MMADTLSFTAKVDPKVSQNLTKQNAKWYSPSQVWPQIMCHTHSWPQQLILQPTLHSQRKQTASSTFSWNCLSVDAPSRDVPSLSVFLPKSCQRTSRRHAVTSYRNVIRHHKMDLCNLDRLHHKKVRKSHFSKWRPWLLTYDLDLRKLRDFIKVNVPTNFCVRMSNCSTVRALNNRRTDRQTHRTDFIPSTADTGGKNG